MSKWLKFSSGFGHLWKKRRPRRRGLTARSDQSLSPSANCSRSRFVVACFRFRTILLVILIAVLQLQSGCGSSSRVERARAMNCAAVRLRLCGLRFFQLWQRWENIIRKMWAVKIYFFRTKIIFSDIRIANQLFTQKIGKIIHFPIWPVFGFNSF